MDTRKRFDLGACDEAPMIRKVRVSPVAAEAAKGDESRTPDIAQDTRDSLVDRLASGPAGELDFGLGSVLDSASADCYPVNSLGCIRH